MMGFFDRKPKWHMDEKLRKSLSSDPRLAASVVLYAGPSGGGKTRAATNNALTTGYIYGLSVLILDPNREWPKAHESFLTFYKRDRKALAFLEDKKRIRTVDSTEGFTEDLAAIKADNANRDGVRDPQRVWLFDEALLERERGNESLTSLALQARNNGVLLAVAGQRMKKTGHPSTRATYRAVVGWRGGEDSGTVLGVDVPNEAWSALKADVLTYVVGATGEICHYDSRYERPLTLVAPCFPSTAEPRAFHGKIVDR